MSSRMNAMIIDREKSQINGIEKKWFWILMQFGREWLSDICASDICARKKKTMRASSDVN